MVFNVTMAWYYNNFNYARQGKKSFPIQWIAKKSYYNYKRNDTIL